LARKATKSQIGDVSERQAPPATLGTSFSVPIIFIDQNGKSTSDQVLGIPCIEVGFFFSQIIGEGAKVSAAKCLASLDTGLSGVSVDEKLIAMYKPPVIGRIGPKPEDRQFLGSIFVLATRHTFNMPIGSMKVAQGEPRIRLGRQFLQFATLIFQRGKTSLIFEG
jgi:hypothetical protein